MTRRNRRGAQAAVLTSEQLDVLASPPTIAIFEALRDRPATVVDLARALGKTPHSLYYHMRKLEGVGLVRSETRQPAGQRPEAVFSLVNPKVKLSREESGAVYRERASKLMRGAVRQALREHTDAQDAVARGDLTTDEIGVLRLRARLSKSNAKELRRRIRELGDWIREVETPRGQLVSTLALVTPVLERDEDSKAGGRARGSG